MTADILHFDNLLNNGASVLGSFAQLSYLRLVGWKTAKYPKEADGSVIGELAESWEISPDKLTITMKMRPGVTWDPRPPTNGRQADAQDVIVSWDKFVKVNSGAASYKYDAQRAPSAPIESMTAPDSRTVVLKLHTPDAAVLPQLCSVQFSPHPREAETGFNPKNEVRGNGPWFVDEYLPSSHITFKRNPDFYIKDRPFYDKVETPIVSDAATRLAQFKAGNVHTDVMAAAQEEVVPTKRDLPETLLMQASSFPERDIWRITFGYEGDSPFKDQRVRQALSMSIDREAYIDALDNRAGFSKDGLDLPVKYGTVIGAGWTGYYVDPLDEKSFGPNGNYLKYNLPEAKKLLAAAGHQNGFAFDTYWNNEGRFPVYSRIVEVYNGWFLDAGLKPKLAGKTSNELRDDYTNVYSSKAFKEGSKPGFNGVLMRTDRPFASPGLATFGTMNKDGPYYEGIAQDGGRVQDGDAKVNELTNKIRGEFDLRKSQELIQELVKYFTGQMYFIPQVSQAKAFSLWWPVIANNGVWDSSPNESLWKESRLHWWLDPTKPPIGRS
jgi:ABC-type transport system substrate-binding protein